MADEEKLRQYLKKAVGELQRTSRRLREAELKESEPIAIVGMGCRFPPDLRSAADLWRFVAGEGDGIAPFPGDRGWGAVDLAGDGAGAGDGEAARQGGFVAGAGLFDAGFFGIGEHEALAMDPQQRLLLETAWDAVEHAGLDPSRLRGTSTGIYAGVSYCDYAPRTRAAVPAAVADHLVTGGAPSTASGRVSYVLGLNGPAISIDTACSSSLVAVHLACQALRRGDCRLALAGGVTIMAKPDVIVDFGRRGALAPDGRCKPFSAAADGMGFGEGAGLLVLERLSAALRDGHRVLALIRGSAVNQDGATNGLTAPSRTAQEAVIRQALADARLTPGQVDAVEGHGTGTVLGDSIEAEAVVAVYGEDRTPDRPLRLGSVKSNIGHTQAASGVASVIKTVMSIRAATHARTLHIDRPSGYVDWSGGKVVPAADAAPWPAGGRPRRAGVSSFGISGTNAHVILEERAAEDGDGSAAAPAGEHGAGTPWVLSAKTAPALRAMAGDLRGFLDGRPGTAAADVGLSLARTRAGFEHRAVVTGAGRAERLAALAALARGEDAPGLATGSVPAAARTAVVFTGRDPGIGDAGRRLAERFPAFAEALDDVCARLDADLGGSVRDLLTAAPDETGENRPPAAHRHAAVFAFQTALYRLVRSFGVAPDLVAGSGIGEIAAAQAAGVLSPADAAALAVAAARRLGGEDADGLRTTAERIGYAKPRVAIVSPDPEQQLSPGYWAAGDFLRAEDENVLQSVRSRGATACLELGPDAFSAPSPDESPAGRLLTRLAEAYTAGAGVSWEAAFTGTGAAQVDLPGYPFQRKRYWLTAPAASAGGVQESGHPLLGGAIDLAGSAERRFTRKLTARDPWYIAQYRLCGAPALPPAAVVEWALAASRHGAGTEDVAWTIENLTIREPLTVLPGLAPIVQAAAETSGTAHRIRGFSRDPGDAEGGWTPRFTAVAAREERPAPDPADLGRLRSRMAEQDPGALFTLLAEAGIDCGPAFRHVARAWRADGESLVLIEGGAPRSEGGPYVLDPVVLETCFLTAMPLAAGSGLRLPSGLERLTCHRRPPRRLWCHARRTQDGPLRLDLFADSGEPLVTITGLTYAAADPARLAPPAAAAEDSRDAEPWDAVELSRLALEEPEAARRTLTDLLFGQVVTLADGAEEDPERLRERFGGARLGELGLDSLRMMRLRERLHARLLVDVPPQRLLGDATVADIVEMVVRSLAVRNLVMAGDEEPDTAGQIEELVL